MMMDAKRQALMDMKSMLKGAKANKMKVMVAGNNPEAVKEGLEKAEDVVEEIPGKSVGMGMPEPKQDMQVLKMVETLSPEQKKQLLKMLMSEGSMEEGEDENETC